MSMLKYVFTFFAFLVVSLAPVYADEGYIPYVPDFLEPDGIGFKGPSQIMYHNCWTSYSGYPPYFPPGDSHFCSGHNPSEQSTYIPPNVPYSRSYNTVRASPITLEYRKNYFFKKLLYTSVFADFGSAIANAEINTYNGHSSNENPYNSSEISSDPFLQGFLTAEEKSKLSSLENTRILDLETGSKYLLFGVNIGFDLWLIEYSFGPYLMYHDTTISLRSCKYKSFKYNGNTLDMPSICSFYPDDIIDLDSQNYSGLAYGIRTQQSIVFLQTDNWRISVEFSENEVYKIFDSNFKPVKYRGLNYYPNYRSRSGLNCQPKYKQISFDGGKNYREMECRNSKGEDMSKGADYTGGLQITY